MDTKSERESFTAYITKHALTVGIKPICVELCSDISPDMVCEVDDVWHSHFHGNDWHRTRDEAVARAEQMRVAKIESLKKQLAKLEKLRF